jgi:DNA-binding MarR family transcriptional regulator
LAAQCIRTLEVVGGMVEARIATAARNHDLSHAALNALAVIEGEGAPVAAGEVAARMHITTGTTTTVLDTLERKGYVRRLADPADRRKVLVDVTPEGQAVLDRLLPEVQVLCRAVMDQLSENQQRQLLRGLEAVRAALAATPDELPPAPARRRPARLTRS